MYAPSEISARRLRATHYLEYIEKRIPYVDRNTEIYTGTLLPGSKHPRGVVFVEEEPSNWNRYRYVCDLDEEEFAREIDVLCGLIDYWRLCNGSPTIKHLQEARSVSIKRLIRRITHVPSLRRPAH